MSMCKPFLALFLSALALQAQDAPDPLAPLHHEITLGHWEKATQELDRAEKEGLCKPAVCLMLRIRIAKRTHEDAQALAYAHRVVALFGPDSGLTAHDYNEVGAILYRNGERDPKTLKLVETAFRLADSIYKGDASNIRYNLATVLKAQGRTKEAKKIMDELEAEGILINQGMAILGDFQGPGVPR